MALCSISNSTHKLPTILVLSSGGVKGILQLGCLHHLYLENKLVNITKYISINNTITSNNNLTSTQINDLKYLWTMNRLHSFKKKYWATGIIKST